MRFQLFLNWKKIKEKDKDRVVVILSQPNFKNKILKNCQKEIPFALSLFYQTIYLIKDKK